MLQLTTAGGLTSMVIGSMKPRKRTGAGVPHWPLRIGSSACTRAPVGANSETQRRNAPITSASDQTVGLGGSFAGEVSGPGLPISLGLIGSEGTAGWAGDSLERERGGASFS